jgi:hypothetical protein
MARIYFFFNNLVVKRENPILPKNKSHNYESKISPTIPKNKSHNSESGNIPKQ